MPLSDHEQHILRELEQSLVREDPAFVKRVRSETLYRHANLYCIWSALGFVVALGFMFFTFSTFVMLGFAGVVVMFASAVVFSKNARRMGRVGFDDFSRSILHRSSGSRAHGSQDSG